MKYTRLTLKVLSSALALAFMIAISGGLLRAQEFPSELSTGIYGFTSIDYDTQSDEVTAYSETDIVGETEYYYAISVTLNSNGQEAYAHNSQGNASEVSATITYQGTTGKTYYAYGQHNVVLLLHSENSFMDPYGMSLWSSYDIDDPDQFDFAPFEQEYPSANNWELGDTYDTAETTIPAACGDQRDTIIQEYEQLGTPYYPQCTEFTQNTGDPVYNLSLLNQGTYSWAILTTYFLNNLHSLASIIPFQETSGYRNPVKEQSVSMVNGGVYHPGSRHQYGDAIDVATTQNTWNNYVTGGHRISACVEPYSVQHNYAHAHLDWRTQATTGVRASKCPTGW